MSTKKGKGHITKLNDYSDRLLFSIWKNIPSMLVAKEGIVVMDIISNPEECVRVKHGKFLVKSTDRNVSFPELELQGKRYPLYMRMISMGLIENSFHIVDYPVVYKSVIYETIKRESTGKRKGRKKIEDPSTRDLITIFNDGRFSLVLDANTFEAFSGALVSFLFDSGMTPHLTRQFSYYTCGSKQYVDNYLLERADFTLEDYINKYKILDPTHVFILKTIITQVVITCFYMKMFFGFLHMDLHADNVMLINMTKKQYVFAGRDISIVKYFAYEVMDRTYIVVENTGLLPKIIDYEISRIDLHRSVLPDFSYDLKIINRNFPGVLAGPDNIDNLAFNSDNVGDVDILRLFINIYDHIKEKHVSPSLESFCKVFIPQLPKVNTKQYENMENTKFDRQGWSSDIKSPILNLIKYLDGCGMKKKYRDRQIYYLSIKEPSDNDLRENTKFMDLDSVNNHTLFFRRFSNEVQKYNMACLKRSKEAISTLSKELGNYSNLKLMCKKQLSRISSANINKFEAKSSGYELNKPILDIFDFESRYLINKTDKYSIYTVQIYPDLLNNKKIDNAEDFELKITHRLLNLRPPPKRMLNKNIDYVNLNVITIDNSSSLALFRRVRGETKNDMFSAAQNILNSDDCIVNGSFFITDRTGNTRITIPSGFYYGYDYYPQLDSGSIKVCYNKVPVPSAYTEHFAFITIKKGVISYHKYDKLLTTHKLKKVYSVHKDTNGNDITTEEFLVDTIDGVPILTNQYRDTLVTDVDYEYAFSTGPILIWKSNIVFDRKLMVESELIQNGIKYSLENAANTKKFFSEPGEVVHGLRNSNGLTAHSALCRIIKNGKEVDCVIMAEGRGFDAYGLDRAQFTALLKKMFNPSYAVSLDGSFSTNCVYKKDRKLKMLIRTPVERDQGFMIYV